MSSIVRSALLSVHDKDCLVEFASGLSALGIKLISTGGTAKHLEEAGLGVTDVSKVTQFPEMLDGRVKTLHPAIHGGILANRDKPEHMSALTTHGIAEIGLVCVNFYPFSLTTSQPGCTFAEAIKVIDIGGPTMVRAAAKNFQNVYVVMDAWSYPKVLRMLQANQCRIDPEFSFELMQEAFRRVQKYDTFIADYMSGKTYAQTLGN